MSNVEQGGTRSVTVVGTEDVNVVSSVLPTGAATEATLLKIPGLSIPIWDYMSLAVSGDTETYVFKNGGSGGSTVATVTIVYTDATRATISTVTKT